MHKQWMDLALQAAAEAGRSVLSYYHLGMRVVRKVDGSPLSEADKASHATLCGFLGQTGLPVVSEEGADLCLESDTYWLVDPLDGTKEFLAGNDEFTVNIALIEKEKPILGVVYAPALAEVYAGGAGNPAHCLKAGVRVECTRKEKSSNLRLAVSRFHDHPDVEIFAKANLVAERVPIGSALKYGRLALAEVDVFPRLVGSSEWDTGAGQAVLEAAGGSVLDWCTGQPVRYGKPNRRNGRLLALRAPYKFSDFKMKEYRPELL